MCQKAHVHVWCYTSIVLKMHVSLVLGIFILILTCANQREIVGNDNCIDPSELLQQRLDF